MFRRSSRLATVASSALHGVPPKAAYVAPSPAPLCRDTYRMDDINERPYKRQKTQYDAQPIAAAPTGRIDTMTVEEFNRFNEALSTEDKEIQANLLMWCITRSIPYTLDLFYQYKRTVQDVRDLGLF